eukprot:s1486_g5.t1
MTPAGPILLRHHAMMFGAASSAWNFNRAADAIAFLSRRLLATAVLHYVDDFIGIEPGEIVQSGFENFARLSRILGLWMKEIKALEPSSSQKVFGINMEVKASGVILSPHPKRCQKLLKTISIALASDILTSDDQTLQGLLQQIQPRVVPRALQQRTIVIYTDAYFVLDGKKFSAGSSQIPTQWSKQKCPTYENGWGYVIHVQGQTYFAAGTVGTFTLEWLASELNISDQVSRHKFDEMKQLRAYQEHPQIETIFKILHRVAGDSDYTHGTALKDLMASSLQLPPTNRTGDVGDLAPVRHQSCARHDLQQELLDIGRLPARPKKLEQSDLHVKAELSGPVCFVAYLSA